MPETAHQLVLPLETHRNHYLFSDHYLNEVLPGQPIWREVEAEARLALAAIKKLYGRQADDLPHYNEAQTEQNWIRPILDALGHFYAVQPTLADAAGTPDYAFFADDAARQKAMSVQGRPAFWKATLAVGDAKRWDRSLDKRLVNGAPDAFTNANPSYQIDYYLKKTGCTWGLISNGIMWRLYQRDTSTVLDRYYEVDLVKLIEQEEPGAFRYFYLFFRPQAFQLDAERRCWLDHVLAQSAAYAVRVGDELKDNVYQALQLLAQGFLDFPTADPAQALDPGRDLAHIHDACLILLYRLLFLFYAESRELLPVRTNTSFREQYSLTAIKEDIADKLNRQVTFLSRRATIWDDLRTLFRIIYTGEEMLGVPAYNGGLFDPDKHPFLEERTIGDQHLAQAIDLLARTEGEFVDYRDLEIRHLGSIYEGLLEYRLECATAPLAVVKDKKGERYVPAEDEAKADVRPGQVYLVTDRGERKATGSYYTPDYIVEYIVEQTLGPLVDETLEGPPNEPEEAILGLNVLDPAMGSGHFLVEATDYLARRIVEAGAVSEALLNGDEESEIRYWRRRVVERCVYGVDLNPLAVELAQLSLWLATVARGKPLSFLDHHLRGGNSLIGARVADLQALPVRRKKKEEPAAQQLAMWDESAFTVDMGQAVGGMQLIQETLSEAFDDIKDKEAAFDEVVEARRERWRQITDLWTAAYFGLELTPELYHACMQHALGKPVLLQAAQAETLLRQAQEIWREKRFFHWEIEFPEIFFDQYGQHRREEAGFDAVVGNPPYDVIAERELGYSVDEEKGYFKAIPALAPAIGYKLNLYRLFICMAVEQLRNNGRFSFIVPMALLGDLQAEPLRRWVLENFQIDRIEAFPQKDDPYNRVFFDAKLSTCIFVLQKSFPNNLSILRIHPGKDILVDPPTNQLFTRDILAFDPDTVSIPLVGQQDWNLALKLGKDPKLCRFGDIAISNQGEVNLTGDKQHLSDAPPGKVVLRGAHVGRYEFYEEPKQGNPYYLNVRSFLEGAGENTKKYHHRYKRIGYQRGSAIDNWRRIIATAINEGEFCSDTINYIVDTKYNLYTTLALLNASVAEWRFRLTSTNNHVNVYEIDALPMPRISFTTPEEERAGLVEEALLRYEAYLEHGEDVLVRAFVVTRLMEEPEQADVIHDFLAYLAERMIEMNKEKGREVRDFLDWLANYTGLALEDWALKTNLRAYYEHDWAEMQRVLERNQRKMPNVVLDVEAYRNEPAQKIRAAWETSMATLRPLLADIEATDRLIDRIVYQLYGLTEEEIAVVEGYR